MARDRRSRSWQARGARLALAALLLGAGLLLLFHQAERLWLPEAWQTPGHLLYRLAFWATLPVQLVLRAISPPVDHHWSELQRAVIAFGSGAALTAIGCWLGWRARRRLAEAADAAAPAEPISRRRFVGQTALGAAGAVAAGVGVYGSAIAPMRLRVRRYAIRIADLPPALDGLTLVQISDTHLGRFVPLAMVRAAVDRANALAPDLVLLTGDYVHGTPRAIGPGIGVFGALRPKIGTLAVLGNHDHWEGEAACRAAFARAGIPLLDNRRLLLGSDRRLVQAPLAADAAGALCIAGLGDLWEDTVAPERALAGVGGRVPRLVLAHNPDTAERLDPAIRVDLMLSGHTHGGQVRLPGLGAPLVPSRYGQKYAGGLCQAPTCRVLVSRGVGLSVMPIRLGVPAEISRVVLTRIRTADRGAS